MSVIYRNIIIVLFMILFPATGNAKRLWDAEGVVTMRNGQPCFSYPQDKVIRSDKSYAFNYLGVAKCHPFGPDVAWEIQLKNDKKKNLVEPNSPETCNIYRVLSPEMKEIHPAKSLQLDTPYRVLIGVSTSSGYHERTFRSDFCLSRDAKGKTVLVGVDWSDSEARCLKPGESPKRSLWQKLFGK